MANTKKKGLFARLIEGPERSEDYARSTLPTNRWSLGWDLFATNFRKIIGLNLLIILFVFPVFILLVFKDLMVKTQAQMSPFSQNIAFGYPSYPFVSGLPEGIQYQTDFMFYICLFVCVFYMAIGISGGFYVMRNMVWTEGVFVRSDFWSGVKKNYKVVLKSSLLYVAVLSLSKLSIDLANLQLTQNNSLTIWLNIAKIISYCFIVFFTIVYLYMITLGVTYELKFFQLIKNAFIFSIALLPLNIFFGLFSLILFIPLLFQTTSIFFSIGIIIILLLSFSVAVLIWTNFSQWAFDEFINDKVAGAKKNRGIYKKTNSNEPEEFTFTKSALTEKPIKPITDYDVEILELPTSYTRKDLERLEESKKAMREDSDKYSEEHKDDYLNSKTTIDDLMNDNEDKEESIKNENENIEEEK